MAIDQSRLGRLSNLTIELKLWKLLIALCIAAILVLWFGVVHQNDEILALVQNEVVTDDTGRRMWVGSFVNTNDRALRDVAVTVEFLDRENRTVGKTDAAAAEMPFGGRLDLQARLPVGAARIRIYSIQWRMGKTAALMGPFREPWEFGYLMVDRAKIKP
jgi:hypothetical protein